MNGIIGGVQWMERVREEVTILSHKVWHSAVILGCYSPRTLWFKLKFSSIKACVVVAYSPNEGDVEERDGF